MRHILLIAVSLCFFFANVSGQTTFWTETFGSGCNNGTLADGYSTPNGAWDVTQTGTNGSLANIWYVSAAENGEGVGNCGAGCGSNPTLHIGAVLGDFGAAYLSEGSGTDEATTDVRAESPVIDCSNQCDIDLSFEYIENGDGALDNHILWYFDGSTWSILDDTPKTPTAICEPQGEWTQYSINLPASADDNPDVRIGFQWVNNDDGVGTDPSIAIYNIQLASNDTEAPNMNCPSEVNAYIEPTINDCEAFIPDLNLSLVPTTDNCTDPNDLVFSQDIAPGSIINNHMTTVDVEVTVEDVAGNTSSCVISIRALDTVSPSMTCPPTQTVYADNDCEGALDDYISLATIEDNCSDINDIVIQQTPASGTIINDDQIVEIEATDEVGNTNTCTFQVDFVDTVSPQITCPSNKEQSTQPGECDTLILDYTDQIVWNDNCTGTTAAMTFDQLPAEGDLINGGNNTVTITATDESGNSKSCDFIVEVLDIEEPEITCPADQEQYVNSNCDISLDDYTGTAVVSDNCSSSVNISVSQTPSIGSTHSGEGTIVSVDLTAMDQEGNTAFCSFNVELIDTVSPQISCPLNDTVSTGTNDCFYELPDYTATVGVTDNCSATNDIIFTQATPAGTNMSPGTYIIGLNAEDESGNAGSCTFQLLVEDQVAPEITECAENDTLYSDTDCEAIVGNYVDLSTVEDNCDTEFDLIRTQLPDTGVVITQNTTVTLSYEDTQGNVSTCQMEVVVIDTAPPEIICPSDFTIAANTSCEYQVPDMEPEVTGDDNCSDFIDMTIDQSISIGTTLTGPDIIEMTLTDESGNSSTCQINLIPDDGESPDITCPSNQSIDIGSDCNYEIDDFTGLATVDDNCSGTLVSQIPSIGTEIGIGEIEVTLIAEDVSGNSSSCTFDLEVTESEAPTIDCPDPITTCNPVVTYSDPVGADNCGDFEITQVDGTGFSSGDEFPVGNTNQSFEITDPSGNTNSCSFSVEVFPAPDSAEIFTADTTMCDEYSLLINANEPVIGDGEWLVVQGSGSFNNEFAHETAVNNLGNGENILVWQISTDDCGENTDTLRIIVNQAPSEASTQGQLFKCQDSVINISASTPTVGQGSWSALDTSITFLNANSVNTVASNLSNGWNHLIWTVSNQGCPSSIDTLRVFKNEKPNIFENDTILCFEDNFSTLSVTNDSTYGSDISFGWYFIEGGGDIENSNYYYTFVENLKGGVNRLVFSQNHEFCGSVTDTITIEVEICDGYNPEIPTVFTPNGDGRNDLFIVQDLHELFPDTEVQIVNRWGSLVYESTGYEDPWDGTKFNSGEELPLGTYFYKIKLNDGSEEVLDGPISIVR